MTLGLNRKMIRAIYPQIDWDEYDREVLIEAQASEPLRAALTYDQLESVAAIEHEQWIEWSKTIAREGLTLERIDRWERYWVPYADLDEATKEHDRKWARKVAAALAASKEE